MSEWLIITVVIVAAFTIFTSAWLYRSTRRSHEPGAHARGEVSLTEVSAPPSAVFKPPAGMSLLADEDLAVLHADIAELNRQLGEERATHKADLVAVKSEAITEMQAYRASVDLEAAQRKQTEAKATAARSRTALVAKIGEHFAPLLGGFPYNFKDARHVGELFDFLVFDGLEDGEIRDIVFLEVKTKRSGARVTNPREKLLRDAISEGRVRYEVFVPDVNDAKTDRAAT